MLDYIGGHIVSVTKTPSGHNVTLQLQGREDDGPIERQFHVLGRPQENWATGWLSWF